MISNILRLLPLFKGKLRLARLLLDRKVKEILVKGRVGKFLLPNVVDHQFFELYVNGHYEKDLIEYICNRLPGGGILLDVGANIGAISIPVALRRPDVRVIAIEAVPRTYTYLERNISINNLTNIIALNVCCLDQNSKHIRIYIHPEKIGSNSLHGLHSPAYIELTSETIDSILGRIGIDVVNFIKIDVEGAEALVLQGASKTIQKCKPEILFEFNSDYEAAVEGLEVGDSQKFLTYQGYTLHEFSRSRLNLMRLIESPLTLGGAEILATKY